LPRKRAIPQSHRFDFEERQPEKRSNSIPSLSWNRKRAAHLYRRAGFGGLPEELDQAVALGREATVDRLVNFEHLSTSLLDAILSQFNFDLESFYNPGSDPRGLQFGRLYNWWALRMIHTPRPLEEKMTLFWHGHFATSNAKLDSPVLLYRQNQIFQTLGMGRFGEFLVAVSTNPAMLEWLDNAANVKDAPNENFARELMELFTMGRGHYTQRDVTEAARALTGWTYTGDRDVDFQFTFDASIHDDGLKVFLGTQGYYKGDDICAILATRPETATFITRKLARFFLGHDPRAPLARRLTDVYVESQGEIRKIVQEILLSDDFDESADHADMIKSPTELLVGAVRSVGARDALGAGADIGASSGAAVSGIGPGLGQFLFVPPSVAGWKGGRDWINTGSYLLRMFAAIRLITGDFADRWDIGGFFAGQSFRSPDALIDFLADRLNMAPPSTTLRQALRDYLAQAGAPFVWTADSPNRWGRGALHLFMVSPEYQLQ
jgi:hypothetical protein